MCHGEVASLWQWKEHISEAADIPRYLIKNVWTGQQGPAEDLTCRLLTRNSAQTTEAEIGWEIGGFPNGLITLKNKESITQKSFKTIT